MIFCYKTWQQTFAHYRWGIRATCWTALLFLAFQLVQLIPYFYFFQYDSEGLVRQTVQTTVEEGKVPYNGLMVYAENRIGNPQLLYNAKLEDTKPYISQVALQARILAALAPDTVTALPNYFNTACLLTALVFALILAAWLATLTTQFGAATTAFVGGLLLATPPLYLFAGNLYWLAPLLFAPFIFSWCLFGKLSAPWFYGGMFLLYLAKLLVGYEFYTNVAAMPLLPIAWYGWQQGKGWRWLLTRAALLSGLCVAAFAMVFCYHLSLIQGAIPAVTDWRGALEVLSERIINRTISDDTFTPGLAQDVKLYMLYYLPDRIPLALQTLFLNQWAILLVSSVLIAARWKSIAAAFKVDGRQFFSLLVLAFLITISWHVLAFGHMRHHHHLAFITFLMPLNLLLFILWGVTCQQAWQRWRAAAE